MRSPAWTPGALHAWKSTIFMFNVIAAVAAKRHVVYWNSTNTRLTQGDMSIQVNLNDYLDIVCPYYANKETPDSGKPEKLALYAIGENSFQGCVETEGAYKRWECNAPHNPLGPVHFSEKIQKFTPFSLGFEFQQGKQYYYSSLPIEEDVRLPCMKLRVTVCCESKNARVGSVSSRTTASLPLLLILLLWST